MTFVLVSREVDLSVGSAYAFASLITGLLIVKAWLLVPALIVGLAAGSAIGLINGLLSTYGKLPSFIATLGMLSVIRGAALLITDGQPVTVDVDKGAKPDVIAQFYYLGQGQLFNLIPMLLVCFVVIAILGWFLLSKTTFGFRVYAVGGRDKVARFFLIYIFHTQSLDFVVIGVLSGLSG